MYGRKLTDQEIKERLVEGRNYKRLYGELKPKFDELKAENTELRRLLQQALDQNKTQAIQIAELQQMVFGKKKKPPTGTVVPVLPESPRLLSSPRNRHHLVSDLC